MSKNSLDKNVTLKNAVLVAGLANLVYFGVEFAVALKIGSVSLFADSVDFLEDACVNFLVLVGLGWSARSRSRLGMLLACTILVPAIATLWVIVAKVSQPLPPRPTPLAMTGLGALLINIACASMLAPFRHEGGSTVRAAFLSARNDIIANIAIVLASLTTAWTASFWPDLIVGIGIAIMNLDAAREVFLAARREMVSAH